MSLAEIFTALFSPPAPREVRETADTAVKRIRAARARIDKSRPDELDEALAALDGGRRRGDDDDGDHRG